MLDNHAQAIATLGGTVETPTEKFLTKADLLDLIFPVGSIYTSMNNVSPATILGGTWEPITDRFLYCADSAGDIGGSKKISVAQLPPHTHNYAVAGDRYGDPDGAADWANRYYYWRENPGLNFNHTSSSTGNGEDYMPPYMTVFCWHRTA